MPFHMGYNQCESVDVDVETSDVDAESFELVYGYNDMEYKNT